MKQFLNMAIVAAGIVSLTACTKADAVLFEDRSTAAKADKATWTVTASSEELTGEGPVNGRAARLLDGDINTFWHSQWAGATPPYPHWIKVDMKKAIKVITVDITARQNNGNGMTKFKLEGSVDGNTWISLKPATGDFVFNPANKASQSFPVSAATAVQHIRITLLEGKVASTHLAELDVFTIK